MTSRKSTKYLNHLPGLSIMSKDIDWSWIKDAQCAKEDIDPDIFFPTSYVDVDNPTFTSGGNYLHEMMMDEAKEVCDRCPVKEQCLETAIELNLMGIWGGMTYSQRRNIRRKRKQGSRGGSKDNE